MTASARRRAIGRNRLYLAGLSPAVFLLALFFVGPAIWALASSFTNRALVGIDAANPRFVGLDNYARLFSDPEFGRVILNSVVFVIGSAIIGQFVLGLLLALLLDYAQRRGFVASGLVYGSALLAWVNPTIIAGFLWVAMFDFYNGSLNTGLGLLGGGPVNWLGQGPMLAIIIANTWRGTAFTMLIFLGALRTIPTDIYEAARVDGAGPFRRFWDHTLPLLRPIASLTLLSVTIATFGTFILIQTLTNGGPALQTEVIALYAYHEAFQNHAVGYGSTIAVVMLTLNLAFAIVFLRWSRARA
ncbi:MAG TPA: sugar ABC transporter permease [Candidatus Limnocylindrales bacterium]|nr:sugar ABC transporter permease [Candidatus Limnocylindrales bacterium]